MDRLYRFRQRSDALLVPGARPLVAYSPRSHIHHLQSRSTTCFRPLSILTILLTWISLALAVIQCPLHFHCRSSTLNTRLFVAYPIPSPAAPTGHASHFALSVVAASLGQLRSKAQRQPLTENVRAIRAVVDCVGAPICAREVSTPGNPRGASFRNRMRRTGPPKRRVNHVHIALR